ncbi:MAG: M48 family metalloprotease [Bacteriovoracaceae bacterium]|nr:M48 family metalloprotease [Bacteriovoracaceae bacterium]
MNHWPSLILLFYLFPAIIFMACFYTLIKIDNATSVEVDLIPVAGKRALLQQIGWCERVFIYIGLLVPFISILLLSNSLEGSVLLDQRIYLVYLLILFCIFEVIKGPFGKRLSGKSLLNKDVGFSSSKGIVALMANLFLYFHLFNFFQLQWTEWVKIWGASIEYIPISHAMGAVCSIFLAIGVIYLLSPISLKFLFPVNELKNGEEKDLMKSIFEDYPETQFFHIDLGEENRFSTFFSNWFRVGPKLYYTSDLFEYLSEKEFRIFMAHELGHYQNHHILKRYLALFLIMPIAVFSSLILSEQVFVWIGLLEIIYGISAIVIFTVTVLMCRNLLRFQEFEADKNILRLGYNSTDFLSTFEKIYRVKECDTDYQSELDQLIHVLSHPKVMERYDSIKVLEKSKKIAGSFSSLKGLFADRSGKLLLGFYLTLTFMNIYGVSNLLDYHQTLQLVKAGDDTSLEHYVLDKKIDLNRKFIVQQGRPFGFLLSKYMNTSSFNKLKTLGLNPMTMDLTQRRTLIHWSVYWNNFELFKSLTAMGIDPLLRDKNGWTPFHLAAFYGANDILDFYMDSGQNINLRTNHNSTPLSLASEKGHFKTVKRLLALGANKELLDDDGDLAEILALKNGHKDTYHLLMIGHAGAISIP